MRPFNSSKRDLSQFHFASEYDKGWNRWRLLSCSALLAITAGAKVTAEQACDTLEQLYRDQPDNEVFAAWLSQAYAAMGEKNSALR